MPGVAPTDSTGSQPQAFEDAMPSQGLDSILGTGRKKSAAAAQKWTDDELVATDEENPG
jgi:hypothetical protein